MSTVYGVVAGIDVHKRMVAVVLAHSCEPHQILRRRKFEATTPALQELRAWLREQDVTAVVMESTAQYWKPVWMTLEEEQRWGLNLAQARSTRAVVGRKSDYADAARLVRQLVSGDLRLSYVPEAEQREQRELTRSQEQWSDQLSQVHAQIEALLEECQIKLATVVSDLRGASARRILWELCNGGLDPEELAKLASARLRATREQLEAALRGRVTATHRMILRLYLEHWELLERQMEQLERATAAAFSPYQERVVALCEIPGVVPKAAHIFLAELGTEAQAFPSSQQCASWVGVCPGRQESAGVSQSNRCVKGNRHLRRLLCQTAWAATRTKDSYLQSVFRRLSPRLGAKKAIWAVAHRICHLVWMVLHEGMRYQERGPLGLNTEALRRRMRRLLRDYAKLGIQLQVVNAVTT